MTKNRREKILVTALGAPPGLNALRALSETGRFDLVAANADRTTPGLYQYGTPVEILPPAGDEEAFIATLRNVVRKHRIDVVLPCIEEEIVVLARRRGDIEAPDCRLLLPPASSLDIAADKGRLAQLCLDNGIPCPKTLVIEAGTGRGRLAGDLATFRTDCPPPWIVKPTFGHGMRGVNRAETIEEAATLLDENDEDMLVQELIPGAIGSVHMVGLLYDRQGNNKRRFISRSIRTLYPTGGPATGGVSVDEPSVIDQSERLLELVGPWSGPTGVEWMRDPRDGVFKLLEINPRLWGYNYLATASGLNFPEGTVDLAMDRDIGPDPGYRFGTTMLRSTVDLTFDTPPYLPPDS